MTGIPRARGAERMDEPDQDPAELARALADLRGVNRWLGGTAVVLRHLLPILSRVPRAAGTPLTLLDVATGSADIPIAVVEHARKAGMPVAMVATDLHPRTVAAARLATTGYPEIRVEPADALSLPYEEGAFDVVLLSTALHHFDDDGDLLRVLRELGRVARWGVIVNDLARSRPALLGARLLAATVWRRHPVTRHDGPLSVRRAFTAAELRDLAERAGLADSRVHTHVPFRVAVVVDRTATRSPSSPDWR